MEKLMILLFMIMVTPHLYAGVERIPVSDETFNNNDCEKNQSCDLLSFRLEVHDSIVTFPNKEQSFLTTANMSYQTKDVASLERFGIVQFIQGCQFTSDSNGGTFLEFNREYFNKKVTYKHPNLVIDSVDADPLYNSDLSDGTRPRHALYRWNDDPKSFELQGEHFFFEEKPSIPQLYVSDRPGTAFYVAQTKKAKNLSLQFKSCIFRIEDIPLESSPEGLKPEQALKCLEWFSSYVYDYALQRFNRSHEIAPVCLGPGE